MGRAREENPARRGNTVERMDGKHEGIMKGGAVESGKERGCPFAHRPAGAGERDGQVAGMAVGGTCRRNTGQDAGPSQLQHVLFDVAPSRLLDPQKRRFDVFLVQNSQSATRRKTLHGHCALKCRLPTLLLLLLLPSLDCAHGSLACSVRPTATPSLC